MPNVALRSFQSFTANDEILNAAVKEIKDAVKNFIPLKRFGLPEEVAAVAAFFASIESAYVTGQVICVDGGMVM